MPQSNMWIQLIGVLAVFLGIISVQEKKQYKILFLQVLANLMYTIQYFLLGVFTAGSMNLVSCGRCYLFYRQRKNNKDIPRYWLVSFVLLPLVFGIITYDGYLSLIPIIITIFYTISSYMKNSKWLRIVFLISAFIWIYYNYVVGAYVCIIGNILEILSGIISLLRFSEVKD